MNRIDQLVATLGTTKSYGHGAIPCAIDVAVDDFISLFSQAGVAERQTILAQMDDWHGLMLSVFADRMASRAVRTYDARFIFKGLEAICIAYKVADSRDVICPLSCLHRACEKLGLDPGVLFGETRVCEDKQSRAFILSFVTGRPEANRGLICYAEGNDDGGFRFIHHNLHFSRKV